MAKTVAEIDGDSSGLVSELGKAKKAMGDLGGEGKKLTDQLKQVADDADIAAGKLINRLGGPDAVKAIGAVGIAFTGAQAVIGAFMDSSEKLFQSYGDEGRKAWEDTEKKVFAVQGAFAAAVLGADDLSTSTERMNTILGLAKNAADLLFLPIKLLSDSLWTMGDNVERVGDLEKENIDIDNKYAAAIQLTNKSTADMNVQFETLLKNLGEVLYSKQQIADIELKSNLAAIDAMILNNDESRQFRANAAADAAAARVQAEAVEAAFEGKMKAARTELEAEGDGRRRALVSVQEVRARAKEMLLADKDFQVALRAQQQAAREQAIAETAKMTEEEKKRNEDLLTMRENTAQRAAEIGVFGTGGGSKGGSKGPGKSAEDEAKEAQALFEANNKLERQLADEALKELITRLDAEASAKEAAMQRVNDFAKKMEEEHDAEIHARGELTVAEQEERNAAMLASVKDRVGQELTLYAQTAVKQSIIGKLSAKEAAEMARKQLGNVIMGLGDKAMAEAGIMAAALNPLAVPMAAAGVAAYAIGGALSADKKAAGSTPATEKAESAAPAQTNYAFNLRVDSVFADGESVARQFAMMQESARQRGLLQQGAY